MLPAPETTYDFDEIGSYKDLTSMSGASILVHYHPFKAHWARVSVGAVYNMTTIGINKSGEETPVGSNDNLMNLSDNPLAASVSFNKVLPYVVWGTGINNREGFGFFLDLGVMYQGSATVTFANNDLVSDKDIQKEISILEQHYTGQAQIWPIVQLGATYMF